MFVTDYVINQGGSIRGDGPIGGDPQMQQVYFEPRLKRPFLDDRGRPCVMVNSGKRDENGNRIYKKELISRLQANGLAINATTTLRKDDWLMIDRAVVRVARERLRAWADLAASNSFGGFDGMSKMVLEHETMSDPGEAIIDMDGLSEGRRDRPEFQLEGLPLPIIHSSFNYSQRQLAASQNSGTPLSTLSAEAATRRVAESLEKLVIGTLTGPTFGDATEYNRTPQVYGYTNFPDRTTKTDVTVPDGTNGDKTVDDVLEMIETAANNNYFGPFMLYHSTDWDKYLDDDYNVSGGNNPNQTLRNRLRQIDQVRDVRRLDFLTNKFTLLLVQMTPEVARAVIGMDFTTVQWETHGGLQTHFKVMTIQVPQLRADHTGVTGIVHGTTTA